MEHAQKLEWLHKIAKLGLEHVKEPEVQHLAPGGAVNPNNGFAGSINSGLGLNNNFQAGAAPIQSGTNAGQVQTAYGNANSGFGQQQGLANQLGSGIVQGQGTQQALAGQLANQAAGVGPNPAQSALNQATGQNIEQQAALMAGQRGAGANAGLLATQTARQGAATQQQAVGQSATLQAQQQLAAQNAQANLAAQQINQGASAIQGVNNSAQNEQNILQGANSGFNNALVGQQSNINNVNAQVATGNQNMASNTFGGLLSGAGTLAAVFAKGGMVRMDQGGKVLDANARKHIAPENFALPGRRYPIHDESHARNALARVSQYGTPAEKKRVKEAVHSKYPGMGAKKMAGGGFIAPGPLDAGMSAPAPQSMAGQWISTPSAETSSGPMVQQTPQMAQGTEDFGKDVKGAFPGKPKGAAPSLAPLEGETQMLAGGPLDTAGMGAAAAPAMALAATGGPVDANNPGEKAVAKGDSLKNDKVPTLLSEGEIVIPRHITMSDRAPEKAAAFVAATLAKRKKSA